MRPGVRTLSSCLTSLLSGLPWPSGHPLRQRVTPAMPYRPTLLADSCLQVVPRVLSRQLLCVVSCSVSSRVSAFLCRGYSTRGPAPNYHHVSLAISPQSPIPPVIRHARTTPLTTASSLSTRKYAAPTVIACCDCYCMFWPCPRPSSAPSPSPSSLEHLWTLDVLSFYRLSMLL